MNQLTESEEIALMCLFTHNAMVVQSRTTAHETYLSLLSLGYVETDDNRTFRINREGIKAAKKLLKGSNTVKGKLIPTTVET